MELPKVRRWRSGGIDRLYVADAQDTDLGWADTLTGEMTIQIPGSEARVEAALEAWSALYPEDDLAMHSPGRHTTGLAAAWQEEIDALSHDIIQLEAVRDSAQYQRDQYVKGTSGEARVGGTLNALHPHGWGVLHSVPIYDARADIDHLLIGPGGVWTVNAKAHPRVSITIRGDVMTIGRTKVNYIPSARAEAAMVKRVLSRHGVECDVRAALVFDIPHDSTSDVMNLPDDVEIMHMSIAVEKFRDLEPVFDPKQVNETFAIARKRETWETPAS